jgi:hypothetical protein
LDRKTVKEAEKRMNQGIAALLGLLFEEII